MLNKRAKTRFYDLIQHVWVSGCITVSLGATGFLGYQLWYYFNNIKPYKQEVEDRFKEELLKEGRMIKDTATDLKQ